MLNVRSLFPKIDEIKLLAKDFDVICLCETWLSSAVNDKLIEIPGYTLFRQDRCSNPAIIK